MNPHFVFNSLNSIKYFLSTNDYAKADKYIDYFSGLIRKFLDYSNNSLIKIEDEAKMINSYLELEKMRLNNKFDFTILISPAVKNKNIPTFIIQPFIENSIKHGVAPSDKSCLIILKFSLEDNKIICIIDDTGIGREESQKMKLSPKAHKSKGIELVREKISIIEEIHDAHIEVKIIDKKENDVSTGTTIAIEIEDKL
jgi:LytS/YehU family sensor histidine kinase